MTDDKSLASGVPMNLEHMREYLQEHYGIPIVLREQGTTNIKCPYCQKLHEHTLEPGHHVAGCSDDDNYLGIGLIIGERYFVPNCGYTIIEYRNEDGVNILETP